MLAKLLFFIKHKLKRKLNFLNKFKLSSLYKYGHNQKLIRFLYKSLENYYY